jgi:hypothetical protein
MDRSPHRSAGQLFAGLALMGFPLAGVLATAIGPAEPDDVAALYETYVAHSATVTVAACLFVASSVAAAVAAVGLWRLLRSRRSLLGRVGAGYLFVGSFGAMGWATGQLLLAQAPAGADREAMIAYFDRASAALMFLVPLQLGTVVGAALLAVALRRAGVIPTWLMLLELGTVTAVVVVQSTGLAATTVGPLTTWTLAVVFYGYLGIRTLQEPPQIWNGDTAPHADRPWAPPARTVVDPRSRGWGWAPQVSPAQAMDELRRGLTTRA